ncbi:MAG: hypothetical protein CMH26_01745 [Micavibrio sp.]|nr:hypothetical protein [Micavibrio sp.]|tara:strand:+ start:2241 stop:3044 length:804 start_codon:yes stop_codon:yes gene_type:complete
MQRLSPTLGIIESGRNCRNFVEDNMSVFWDVFKPLLPYLVGLYLFDLLLFVLFDIPAAIGSLISSYFMGALAITWHRVVLHGPDRYEPMNPLKPQKHELIFMLMLVGLCLASVIFMFALFFLSAAILPEGSMSIMLAIFASIVFLYFIVSRLSFYFPAKAVGADLSLIEAFKLSEGFVWKVVLTPMCATWKVLLKLIIVIIPLSIVAALIILPIGGSSEMVNMVMQIPMLFYFSPLLTVLGITVLSNFYQYALQYHGQDHSGETHID